MRGGDLSPECAIEFRAFEDDAWYSVKLLPERDDDLRIKYVNLSEEHDFVFKARNLKELEDFEGRFRNVSAQLQDNECRSVVEGMKVCASHSFSNGDIRFYDALVKEVHENQHSFEKGEEVCSCTFSLLWLHGPDAGKLSTKAIENVCKIQRTLKLDPVIASFLKTARDRFDVSSKSNLISNGITGLEVVPYSDDSSNSGRRPGFFERLRQETRCAKLSVHEVSPSEAKSERIVSSHDIIQEDRQLAVERNQYLILVGNLDIALSPPTIIEFLQRQTSLVPRVHVYPCLRSEPYTRGAILLDCESDFQKLWDFLTNPNHIIISTAGRPLVITEKMVGLKNIEASIGTLMPITEKLLQKRSRGESNKLTLVSSGTKKFEIANNLRNLFLEFAAHQERLHKRLAFEEARVFAADSFDV